MVTTFNKLIAVVLILVASSCSRETTSLDKKEVRTLAKEAYLYGFPLVMNYKTLYANVINQNSGDYKGEFNQKSCEARLFTPEDKAIVTPNSDTPYCMFWSDIRNEPIVFSVPNVDASRYYSFQLTDLFTHNFFYLGTLTTGNKAGSYMVASKSWNGKVPEGIAQVIRCETGLFFTIIRTQLFNADDLENVKELQNEPPGESLQPNWLPAPDGPFYCVMRLYGPEEEVLQGNCKTRKL